MNKFLLTVLFLGFAGFIGAQTIVKFKLSQPQELTVTAGDDVTIAQGETASIGTTHAASGGTPEYYYTWYPPYLPVNNYDGTAIANARETTEFTLKVSDLNNCSAEDKMTVTVNNTSGINAYNTIEALSIYPNPATNYFKVKPVDGENNIKVSLLTTTGQVIYTDEPDSETLRDKQFELPREQGIYLVQLKAGSLSKTIQLVVQEN